MRFTRTRKERTGEFDMTPMIDVVLQLIIFFMYTTQISSIVRSKLDLPRESGDQTTTAPAQIIIDVRADGTYMVESNTVTRDRLLQMVMAEVREVPDPSAVQLLIRADRNAPTRYINILAEDLAKAGIRGWKLGTEAPRGTMGTQ